MHANTIQPGTLPSHYVEDVITQLEPTVTAMEQLGLEDKVWCSQSVLSVSNQAAYCSPACLRHPICMRLSVLFASLECWTVGEGGGGVYSSTHPISAMPYSDVRLRV